MISNSLLSASSHEFRAATASSASVITLVLFFVFFPLLRVLLAVPELEASPVREDDEKREEEKAGEAEEGKGLDGRD